MSSKILFIDEESVQQDRFVDYIEAESTDVEVKCMVPLSSLEDMLHKIEGYCPDAIVTDFQLNEIKTDVTYTVQYNGIDLVNAIREQWENFPCFVITSFDDEAVNSSEDVNLVYIKDLLNRRSDDKSKVTFLERVLSQIDKYRARIAKAKQELATLILKRKSGAANIYDEQRLIEIDTFLEKSVAGNESIPEDLKKLSNIERLNALIAQADEILERVK